MLLVKVLKSMFKSEWRMLSRRVCPVKREAKGGGSLLTQFREGYNFQLLRLSLVVFLQGGQALPADEQGMG